MCWENSSGVIGLLSGIVGLFQVLPVALRAEPEHWLIVLATAFRGRFAASFAWCRLIGHRSSPSVSDRRSKYTYSGWSYICGNIFFGNSTQSKNRGSCALLLWRLALFGFRSSLGITFALIFQHIIGLIVQRSVVSPKFSGIFSIRFP